MRQAVQSACLTIFLLLSSAFALRAQMPAQQAAGQAEIHWLHLVDAGQYAAAWRQQAPYARNIVSEQNFIRAMRVAREPLGAVKRRTLLSAESTDTLPGAPDGAYIVARYKTDFADKRDATETLAAERQPNGRWEIDGYHIH